MSETYKYITDWRNIGIFASWRFHPNIGLRTPWGNLIIKRWRDRLFSERYSTNPGCVRFLGLCIAWKRLRQFTDYSALVNEAAQDVVMQSTPLTELLAKQVRPRGEQ